jgi:hypothetical protein
LTFSRVDWKLQTRSCKLKMSKSRNCTSCFNKLSLPYLLPRVDKILGGGSGGSSESQTNCRSRCLLVTRSVANNGLGQVRQVIISPKGSQGHDIRQPLQVAPFRRPDHPDMCAKVFGLTLEFRQNEVSKRTLFEKTVNLNLGVNPNTFRI